MVKNQRVDRSVLHTLLSNVTA